MEHKKRFIYFVDVLAFVSIDFDIDIEETDSRVSVLTWNCDFSLSFGLFVFLVD